ncbi:protein-glucosylgalactosylhydroxylysine glucosidase-like [Patella vulgata]|uniref:protein-glucosylgalactosylhydroxylysine glucosidase-like n=1 Tax=Patella vulgata TaxID=6465 RepID=UPI0024A98989|nr:protein-glucosylgalactosylhydroxylysine glucosidase-like [Patella vulgata]
MASVGNGHIASVVYSDTLYMNGLYNGKLRTYAHQHYTQLMVTEIEIIRTQNIGNDSLNHVDSWADKWTKGRIEVGGDTELNTLVHSSMYYTLSSLPSTDPNQPNEPFYGLSPEGLANGDNSTDFRGHVLIDMEAWMYPSESGVSGDELSFGEVNHEFITADIAFAARQYISATRDLNWLRRDSGYTFIRDLANFLQSMALWNDVKAAYEINVSAVVKEVDAILLGFPLMFEMNETVRRSDLAIYENLTDPKSSAMTWAMFAINLLEIGDTEKAFKYFQKSHSSYPRKPFNVSGEGDINFSGMGTFLQTLIYGYAGARLHVEKLTFEPKLPKNVTSLHFLGLDYLETTFDLYINNWYDW